jgi:hypothetical protein
MRHQFLKRAVCGMAVLMAPAALGVSQALAGDWDRSRPDALPEHFGGLLNDHTPSNAVVKGGPYEMRGKWSLEVDERHGTGRFSASMDMQTSDYGIIQATVDKDNPATRGAHTHHISMRDGVLTLDWQSRCPTFSPAATQGFVITGTAFVTGNGSPAPFGNPSPFTVCVLGGQEVKFANVTVTLGTPAANHFGTQAIHGVVQWCTGRFLRPSSDCSLDH